MAWVRGATWGGGWEEEKDPYLEDFGLILAFALVFPIARFILDRFVLQRIGRKFVLGSVKHLSAAELEERQKKLVKFKESGWKCMSYLSEELLALAVTYNEPWFTDTRKFWVGPGDQVWPEQKIKTKLRMLYMYAGGFYTYNIFALILWETRRSDFGVSMSHHVTTLALIVFSYVAKFARVGSVVLSLHDASDVFLEIGKMTKYCGLNLIPSLALICFAVVWLLLRLIYFPFWVIRSTSYEVLETFNKEKHKKKGPIYYYVFNSLLISLLVLNMYWWVLILRVLVKQIQDRGKLGEDVRSDSEGEEDDDKDD
ncbi:hypothetical protein GOP47_0013453 [Adiantum capillus-veneris]|uniref:TLC domain-containing protein n=1 Tax=Adiantum capillus-veneris TaxID=13818 RepID=A0A9D4UPI2_ADICA|nr:hypothetical protein GOP47_0013453 [Adiantum capillus-veneris]